MTSRRQTELGYALLLAALTLLLASAAQAKTINVPADYATIQAAIDAAVRWDTVVVAPGTYKECIDFRGKAITVRSTKPTWKSVVAATIIDGDQKGSVVTFQSGEKARSTLSGFTITNGNGSLCADLTGAFSFSGGGGILCNGASPTIRHNTVTGNSAAEGAGILCWNYSAASISFCAVTSNVASSGGGGVMCYWGSSPTITHSTLSGNTGGNGGALFCHLSSSPLVADNVIEDNHAWGGHGAGINCAQGSAATIERNTICDNTSDDSGGGIYAYDSAAIVRGNTISGNSAWWYGGGVCLRDGAPGLSLVGNTISGNTTLYRGGGIYCNNASPQISGNTISSNVATYGDGGGGGGLYCENHSSPALDGNVISDNQGLCGGGIACYYYSSPKLTNNTIAANSTTYLGGGGIHCEYASSPVVRNTIVALNRRGGLFVADPEHPSTPAVSYCDFYGNTGGNYVNWPNQTGKNGNTSKNPLFAWATKGDFHEKSKGGRWNPATKTWVIDTVHSPCIDAGDPTSAFNLEPAPNGGRINMGAYGNTAEASKSAPVSASGALMVSASCAPVTGGAQVSVNLSAAARVNTTISNLAGRPITALPSSNLPQGISTLLWNGKSAGGLRVPSGRYLVRVTARTADGTQAQALSSLSLLR